MSASRWTWITGIAAAVLVLAIAIPASGMLTPSAHDAHHTPFSSGRGWHHAPTGPYTLSFQETGLPTGTVWAVTVFGPFGNGDPSAWSPAVAGPEWRFSNSNRSNGTAVDFGVANGTFDFFVHYSWNGGTIYVPDPSFGNVSVNGSNASVSVVFTPLTYYHLTFSETGLPSGTFWSVALNGSSPSWFQPDAVRAGWSDQGSSWNGSTGSNVNFTVPNGNYSYAIGNVTNGSRLYVPTPASGNVTVNGSSATVDVTFSFVPLYTVSFVESGLPAGTNWSVSLWNNTTGWFSNSSSNTTLNVTVPNGVYNFSVGNVSNCTRVFVPSPANGTVTVLGANVTVDVTFATVPVFTVTFSETGLPPGTFWEASLWDNTSGWFWNGSANATLNFTVPNGVYNFTIGSAANGSAFYVPTPASGTVTVDGTGVTVSIVFVAVPLYAVTFNESGLPNGTAWFVVLSNGSFGWTFNVSANSTVGFLLPNGSYQFEVGFAWNSTGWFVPSPAYGTVNVSGANVSIAVTFAAGNGPCPQGSSNAEAAGPAAAHPAGRPIG
jgi:hypothetical protein